jgi:predicted nucleic acid-binding protein
MGLIVDTSILIAIERKKISWDVMADFVPVCISSVTVMELFTGLNRSHMLSRRPKAFAFAEEVLERLEFLPFGLSEAKVCASLKDGLTDNGITIGAEDLMIASTAIVAGYPLMTLNKSDFIRIPGLEIL